MCWAVAVATRRQHSCQGMCTLVKAATGMTAQPALQCPCRTARVVLHVLPCRCTACTAWACTPVVSVLMEATSSSVMSAPAFFQRHLCVHRAWEQPQTIQSAHTAGSTDLRHRAWKQPQSIQSAHTAGSTDLADRVQGRPHTHAQNCSSHTAGSTSSHGHDQQTLMLLQRCQLSAKTRCSCKHLSSADRVAGTQGGYHNPS
jgi:hypothetical protein